jgi:hypothetical protein
VLVRGMKEMGAQSPPVKAGSSDLQWARGRGSRRREVEVVCCSGIVMAVCSVGALAPSFTGADRLRLRRRVRDRLVFARVLLRERLRGGPDVKDMAEALGGEPYWQELAARLQLRGPRRRWREGRWVLMEHVSRGRSSAPLPQHALLGVSRSLSDLCP